MKAILATEKKADDIEKRLTEHLEELNGIEKVKLLLFVNLPVFLPFCCVL